MSNVLLRLQFVPLSSLRTKRAGHRVIEHVTERDAPTLEENPLRDENLRILGILDVDRSADPHIKHLRKLCTTYGFAIRTEFVAEFLSRLHRERKIEGPELHQLLILIDTAASM